MITPLPTEPPSRGPACPETASSAPRATTGSSSAPRLPRRHPRQRGADRDDGRPAAGHARLHRTRVALPALRRADEHESARGFDLRPGRRVTCGRWPVRRLARLPREGACPLPGAGRRHEHPAVVKHPFWKGARTNPWAAYAAVSFDPVAPEPVRSGRLPRHPGCLVSRFPRSVVGASRRYARVVRGWSGGLPDSYALVGVRRDAGDLGEAGAGRSCPWPGG